MVYEIAEIDITPGRESAFEANVAKAGPLFQSAKGCHAARLERSIEHPGRYRLVVTWETVEDHMVDFRGSAAFGEWRTLIGDCLAGAPRVEHSEEVLPLF